MLLEKHFIIQKELNKQDRDQDSDLYLYDLNQPIVKNQEELQLILDNKNILRINNIMKNIESYKR